MGLKRTDHNKYTYCLGPGISETLLSETFYSSYRGIKWYLGIQRYDVNIYLLMQIIKIRNI